MKKKPEEALRLQTGEAQARHVTQATLFLYRHQQPRAEAPTPNSCSLSHSTSPVTNPRKNPVPGQSRWPGVRKGWGTWVTGILWLSSNSSLHIHAQEDSQSNRKGGSSVLRSSHNTSCGNNSTKIYVMLWRWEGGNSSHSGTRWCSPSRKSTVGG